VAASSTTDSTHDGQESSVGHGIAGVEAEIEQDLLHLALVRLGYHRLGASAEINADVFGKQTRIITRWVATEAVEINAFPLERLPASEGEKLPGELTWPDRRR